MKYVVDDSSSSISFLKCVTTDTLLRYITIFNQYTPRNDDYKISYMKKNEKEQKKKFSHTCRS